MGPRERGARSEWPPRDADRRATWRSVFAGVAVNVGLIAVIIAASYPALTGLVAAAGIGAYAMTRILPPSSLDRRLRLSRTEVSFCFQLRLE